MRIFFNPLIKLMAVFAAIGILAACGEDSDSSYDYCVYDATQKCLFGPFKECQSGGLLSNSCPYQDAAISSSSSITTGGGTSSSSSIGGGTNYSLNGVWEQSNGRQVTVNGSTGVLSSLASSPGAITLDAINKGYMTLGGQYWRNLTSTGNLTWSGQIMSIEYNSSNPNVATGTTWNNFTITMSADGQTIVLASADSDGAVELTWTRSNYSLNGVWEQSNGRQVTVNGSTGVLSSLASSPGAITLDAINKGYMTLGGQYWRNLTSTGNLTWSGQIMSIEYNSSNPNVATGTTWNNFTITMSADGQTIVLASADSDGAVELTWTRKQ